MDQQLRNALVLQDVEFVEELLNPSEPRHPPVIGYKALLDQLLELEWPLQKVVELGRADLTRLFLRASNESTNVDEGLHRAVYNFDVAHVRLFLQEFNADPNSFYLNSRTPIYHLYSDDYEYHTEDEDISSDAHNAVEIMKMLIDKGANIITPRDGYNDLQVRYILENGTTEVVSIILDLDVIDLNEQYNRGKTVAHYLARNRNPNTLTLLHNRDFPVDLRDHLNWTPLWSASDRGVAEAVKFLLEKGADVNIGNTVNFSPLYIATRGFTTEEGNYMECILLLLEYGADVQRQSVADDDHPSCTVFDVIRVRTDRHPSEVLTHHLALQAAIGTTITKLVQNKVDSNDILKEQHNIGRKLLQSKIYGSRTLFSVLTCGEEKLVSLMRNEQLAEELQSHWESIGSIYYSRLLQKRLTKASQIVKLRRKVSFVVGKLMKMNHNYQPIVVDIVLSYLDLADLNTLLSLSL